MVECRRCDTEALAHSVRLARWNNPTVWAKDEEGESVDPIQRSFNNGSFRDRFHRRLVSIVALFQKFRSTVAPQAQQVGTQRMCPFCGLITPRAKRLCLECGRPLRAIHVERKDAQ